MDKSFESWYSTDSDQYGFFESLFFLQLKFCMHLKYVIMIADRICKIKFGFFLFARVCSVCSSFMNGTRHKNDPGNGIATSTSNKTNSFNMLMTWRNIFWRAVRCHYFAYLQNHKFITCHPMKIGRAKSLFLGKTCFRHKIIKCLSPALITALQRRF